MATARQTLSTAISPPLPTAPVEYAQQYTDQFNSILRLYFTQLDNLTSALLEPSGSRFLSAPYGSFADTTDQTIAAANTATVMTFNTTDFANDVRIVTSGGKASRFTVDNAGIYNFQWSGQFQNTDSQEHDVSVWVRKNGVDIVGSTGFVAVVASHGGIDGHLIAGWNFLFSLAANDYIELWWSATSTAVSIQAYPAVTTPPAAVKPSTSSLVATMTYVSRL